MLIPMMFIDETQEIDKVISEPFFILQITYLPYVTDHISLKILILFLGIARNNGDTKFA